MQPASHLSAEKNDGYPAHSSCTLDCNYVNAKSTRSSATAMGEVGPSLGVAEVPAREDVRGEQIQKQESPCTYATPDSANINQIVSSEHVMDKHTVNESYQPLDADRPCLDSSASQRNDDYTIPKTLTDFEGVHTGQSSLARFQTESVSSDRHIGITQTSASYSRPYIQPAAVQDAAKDCGIQPFANSNAVSVPESSQTLLPHGSNHAFDGSTIKPSQSISAQSPPSDEVDDDPKHIAHNIVRHEESTSKANLLQNHSLSPRAQTADFDDGVHVAADDVTTVAPYEAPQPSQELADTDNAQQATSTSDVAIVSHHLAAPQANQELQPIQFANENEFECLSVDEIVQILVELLVNGRTVNPHLGRALFFSAYVQLITGLTVGFVRDILLLLIDAMAALTTAAVVFEGHFGNEQHANEEIPFNDTSLIGQLTSLQLQGLRHPAEDDSDTTIFSADQEVPRIITWILDGDGVYLGERVSHQLDDN